MKMLHDSRSLGCAEKRNLRAAFRSAAVASRVRSLPAFNSRTRTGLLSKPTVRYFLPNSTASGKPTYPSPMTPILCLLKPRIAAPCQTAQCKRCRVRTFGRNRSSEVYFLPPVYTRRPGHAAIDVGGRLHDRPADAIAFGVLMVHGTFGGSETLELQYLGRRSVNVKLFRALSALTPCKFARTLIIEGA